MVASTAVMAEGDMYTSKVAFVFIFNLIVGTGALALPQAMAKTGLLFGGLFLAGLAFMSYMTVTFVIEVMAATNAHIRLVQPNEEEADEQKELISQVARDPINTEPYEITRRTELGLMAEIFFNKIGVRLFYIVLAVYLYGDLAIYAVAVPKSLASVTCPEPANHDGSTWHCFGSLNSDNIHYVYVTIFAAVLGPFAFTNVQKTKYLQLATTLLRYTAFLMMIIIGFMQCAKGDGVGVHGGLSRRDIGELPNLFGVAIYAFMCHHSLPSLVTPIRNKSQLRKLFAGDVGLVFSFYLLLCVSAMVYLPPSEIKDIYTLNFKDYSVSFVGYFLGLFPVFTISASFPIILITLRNNLKTLFYNKERPYPYWLEHVGFPLLALIPPICIAYGTTNVQLLVNVTGSYPGLGVQFIVPASLVYCARKRMKRDLGKYENTHMSPFQHVGWFYLLAVWSVACIGFVTYHLTQQ
eukprot:Opistho-2@5947